MKLLKPMKGPRDPRFLNKDGSITRYSFVCGYIESYVNGVHIELENREVNIWSIKGPLKENAVHGEGRQRWEQCEGSVRKARRIARRMAADPQVAQDHQATEKRLAAYWEAEERRRLAQAARWAA